MSFIKSYRTNGNNPKCSKCMEEGVDRDAECVHHTIYRSEGGKVEIGNEETLCFYHHHQGHASKGDWSRWGRNGGKSTASNPWNLRNLRQFKAMSDEEFNKWCLNRLAQ
jgi:HNH endonuclease